MKNKQTAVEWIESQFERYYAWVKRGSSYDEDEQDIFDGVELYKAFEQAKQMEKEQKIEFAMRLHKVDINKTRTDNIMDETGRNLWQIT